MIIKRFLLLALLLGLGVSFGGCRGPLEPRGALDVSARAAELRLKNRTGRPIAYLVMERETAGLIYWAPGARPDPGTPELAPHAEVRLPYGQLRGYHAGATQAIIYWWDLAETDETAGAHTIIVNL